MSPVSLRPPSRVLTSSPAPGCAWVSRRGGELCAAAGAAERLRRGDAGPAFPAAALLSSLLHGWKTLLQVGGAAWGSSANTRDSRGLKLR